MNLHTLKPAAGSTKRNKRLGRGQGSGTGGTASRGHKGQKSRSGYSKKRNFEGGQMPLQMRLPKRGFNSPNRVAYKGINLDQLEQIAEKYASRELTHEFLVSKRIVKKTDKIKILGRGALTGAITVEAHAITAAAKEAIDANGGSIKLV